MLLKDVSHPIDSISLKLILGEMYETMYGIHNHDAVDEGRYNPLALVSVHPKERIRPYDLTSRIIYRFALWNIKEHFGLSLTEFLNLTRDQTETLFEMAQHFGQKNAEPTDAAIRALEKLKPS